MTDQIENLKDFLTRTGKALESMPAAPMPISALESRLALAEDHILRIENRVIDLERLTVGIRR